ncbi:MAG: hypothetical protein K6G30_07050, partial [Acetatifactor sp.]|nr:hypothetical protein [Acetatifactor sp.]
VTVYNIPFWISFELALGATRKEILFGIKIFIGLCLAEEMLIEIILLAIIGVQSSILLLAFGTGLYLIFFSIGEIGLLMKMKHHDKAVNLWMVAILAPFIVLGTVVSVLGLKTENFPFILLNTIQQISNQPAFFWGSILLPLAGLFLVTGIHYPMKKTLRLYASEL